MCHIYIMGLLQLVSVLWEPSYWYCGWGMGLPRKTTVPPGPSRRKNAIIVSTKTTLLYIVGLLGPLYPRLSYTPKCLQKSSFSSLVKVSRRLRYVCKTAQRIIDSRPNPFTACTVPKSKGCFSLKVTPFIGFTSKTSRQFSNPRYRTSFKTLFHVVRIGRPSTGTT